MAVVYAVECDRFISGRQLELGLVQRHLAASIDVFYFDVFHPYSRGGELWTQKSRSPYTGNPELSMLLK